MATVHVNPRLRERTSLEELFTISDADLRSPLEESDKVFREMMKQQFATEGQSGGERWPALSPEYAQQKDRWFRKARARFAGRQRGKLPGTTAGIPRGRGENKILQLTGALKRALSTQSAEHVATWVRTGATTLRLYLGAGGSAGRIGTYHAPGPNHNPKLPIRDAIQMTTLQREQLLGALVKGLAPFLERVGRTLRTVRLEVERRAS